VGSGNGECGLRPVGTYAPAGRGKKRRWEAMMLGRWEIGSGKWEFGKGGAGCGLRAKRSKYIGYDIVQWKL